jgi:hypothetical protein
MKILPLLLALPFFFCACTNSKDHPDSASGSVTAADPAKPVFEVDLSLPAKFKNQVKRTDLLIWDLKSSVGAIVAAQMIPVPKFPFHLTVQTGQLRQPVSHDMVLMFSARVVKFGDERKPPLKGQLNVLVGDAPSKNVVINPAVDKKRFAKWAKQHNFAEAKVLTVGAKAQGEFTPILW